MGRIKTQLVKRLTKKLMDIHLDEFTEDFGQNKKLVRGWISESSPKIRNIIAGYVTRLKKMGYGGEEFMQKRAPPPRPKTRMPRSNSY